MAQLLQDLGVALLAVAVAGVPVAVAVLLIMALVKAGRGGGGRSARGAGGGRPDAGSGTRGQARGALSTAGGLAGKAWGGIRSAWREGGERLRGDGDGRHRDRRNRQAAATGEPPAPTLADRLTGRCPWCSHHPKAAETDGCDCEATDWACPCAMRNRSAARRRSAEVGEPSSTDDRPPPDEPEPTDLDNPGEPAAVQDDPGDRRPGKPTGGTMPTTTNGEVVNIEQTRRALGAIGRDAMQQVEIANAALASAVADAAAIEQMTASLTTADLDAQTLADISALQEQAAAGEAAARALLAASEARLAAAQRAVDGLNRRHSGVEEAVNSTQHAAKTKYYQHA